jgi:hypothetical protein
MDDETQQNDARFLKLLDRHFSTGFDESVIRYFPGILCNLQGLRMKCFMAQDPAMLKRAGFTIYDNGTCIEFHKLLITTLLGYASNLHVQRHNQGEMHGEVFNYLYLLWAITESRAFRLHMNILARADKLTLPKYELFDNEYVSFAEDHGLSWVLEREGAKGNEKGKGWNRNGKGKREGEGGEQAEQGQGQEALATMAKENMAEAEENEDPNDEDADLKAITYQGAIQSHQSTKRQNLGAANWGAMESHGQIIKRQNLGAAYRRYVTIHVAAFGAVLILRRYCAVRSQDPETMNTAFQAPCIAVQKSEGLGVSWSGITRLLQRLAVQNSSDENDAIQKRKVEFEDVIRKVATESVPSSCPAFKQFRRLLDGGSAERVWPIKAAVHCEVALAAILKYGTVLLPGMKNDKLHEQIMVREVLS